MSSQMRIPQQQYVFCLQSRHIGISFVLKNYSYVI